MLKVVGQKTIIPMFMMLRIIGSHAHGLYLLLCLLMLLFSLWPWALTIVLTTVSVFINILIIVVLLGFFTGSLSSLSRRIHCLVLLPQRKRFKSLIFIYFLLFYYLLVFLLISFGFLGFEVEFVNAIIDDQTCLILPFMLSVYYPEPYAILHKCYAVQYCFSRFIFSKFVRWIISLCHINHRYKSLRKYKII